MKARILSAGFFVLLAPFAVQAQTVIVQAVVMPPVAVYSNMKFGTAAQLMTNLVGGTIGYPYGGTANEGGYGLMRTRSWAESTASNAPSSFSAHNISEWVDTLTVVPPPELDGHGATMELTFMISGTGSAFAAGAYTCSSSCDFLLKKDNSLLIQYSYTWNGDGSFSGQTPTNSTGPINLSAPIVLGTPFSLLSRVNTWVQYSGSSTNGIARAFVDYSRNSQWVKVNQITGDFGVLSNFTITSASGSDWLNVPVQPQPLLKSGGMTDEGQTLALNGLSIAYTNILEAAESLDSTNWVPVATYVNVSGLTNQMVDTPANIQFFRVRQK